MTIIEVEEIININPQEEEITSIDSRPVEPKFEENGITSDKL